MAAAAKCAGTNRYQIHKSVLGSIIFKYHSYVYWCWDGSGTHIRTHYPYLSSAQSVVVFKSTLINTVRSFGVWSKETHHQAHIELCTLGKLGGCYANIYPSNWVLVKNAAGSTFRWAR
jgi:hypothetical protein